MPLINHAKKEINAKIIYFGPAASGKAANLNFVYSKLREASRGQFKTMDLQKDRMLFFDFLPTASASIDGYSIRFHVYTMSGTVNKSSSWNMVMKGADGVVFVADSNPDCSAGNVESFRALNAALAVYGRSSAEVPIVIQCNKQDVAGALPPEQIVRVLDAEDLQHFSAAAGSGEGVLDPLFAVVKMVLKSVRAAGIQVADKAEQLQPEGAPVRQPVETERATGHVAASMGPSRDPVPLAFDGAGDGPVIESAGVPEVVDGILRLPLSLRWGGEVKEMTLSVSLALAVS